MAILACLASLGPLAVRAGDASVATNCREMVESCFGQRTDCRRFDVTGTVVAPDSARGASISLEDKTGAVEIGLRDIDRADWPQAGDRVRITGSFLRESSEVYIRADVDGNGTVDTNDTAAVITKLKTVSVTELSDD